MKISFRTAQAETHKQILGYVIENLKLIRHLIQSVSKIRRNQNPESFLCDDNANIKSARLFFFRLLQAS